LKQIVKEVEKFHYGTWKPPVEKEPVKSFYKECEPVPMHSSARVRSSTLLQESPRSRVVAKDELSNTSLLVKTLKKWKEYTAAEVKKRKQER